MGRCKGIKAYSLISHESVFWSNQTDSVWGCLLTGETKGSNTSVLYKCLPESDRLRSHSSSGKGRVPWELPSQELWWGQPRWPFCCPQAPHPLESSLATAAHHSLTSASLVSALVIHTSQGSVNWWVPSSFRLSLFLMIGLQPSAGRTSSCRGCYGLESITPFREVPRNTTGVFLVERYRSCSRYLPDCSEGRGAGVCHVSMLMAVFSFCW